MARRLTQVQAWRIGTRLKEARIKRGLSLQELASTCEMHHSQASRVERGQFKTLAENVLRMCKILDVALTPDGAPVPHAQLLQLQMTKLLQTSPESSSVLMSIMDALESFARADPVKR
mgnify:CR=1 FL=1